MMNSKIYGKLAVTNLKNNRKSYIPYILASAFSVMMYFIMDNLYRNRSLVEKGSPLAIMLSYADAVLLIFSIIFLFYINSFLIKRRKKELGIYNILGMGKGHLGKMLFLESVITTVAKYHWWYFSRHSFGQTRVSYIIENTAYGWKDRV